jgi:light-regulated signal transduction histidine kinase (bacteriophytochrome)
MGDNEVNQEIVALLRDEALRYNVFASDGTCARASSDCRRSCANAADRDESNRQQHRSDEGREWNTSNRREVAAGRVQQILVSISDTGTGFPQRLSEQIFDPYFTTKPRSIGMGLRICRLTIESHGGRLWRGAQRFT